MSLIQPVAALLLVLGSVLVLRLVWLADADIALAEPRRLQPAPPERAEDFRRAA